jgi:hypothetical protein
MSLSAGLSELLEQCRDPSYHVSAFPICSQVHVLGKQP